MQTYAHTTSPSVAENNSNPPQFEVWIECQPHPFLITEEMNVEYLDEQLADLSIVFNIDVDDLVKLFDYCYENEESIFLRYYHSSFDVVEMRCNQARDIGFAYNLMSGENLLYVFIFSYIIKRRGID